MNSLLTFHIAKSVETERSAVRRHRRFSSRKRGI